MRFLNTPPQPHGNKPNHVLWIVIEFRPVLHLSPTPSGCLRKKLKSQPRSACRISRR
jgi:hypothetical protein